MVDFTNIIAFNRSLAPALTQAVTVGLSSGRALMDERIFVKGLDSSNGKIGNYKTASYVEFKKKRGRQANFVDLRFQGDLKNSLQVIPISDKEVGIGFLNEFEALKASVNEDRYNKEIFALSADEQAAVLNVVIDELVRFVS